VQFARMTTPERIDRMKQMRAQRQQQMDQRLDATKAFYAALNAQQQRTFDEQSLDLLKGGRRGHGRGGHRGGHHGGMGR
jgi:periplasmic protein CpxP/Spy